jgi:hypothetical protein
MLFEIITGTGRAECQLCHQKIDKGTQQLRVTGYRSGGNIHRHAMDCFIAERFEHFGKKIIRKGE